MTIEFDSYTGRYPCLCMGVLTLIIDGEKYVFSNLIQSGGTCFFDTYGNKVVKSGKWKLRDECVPNELVYHKEEILEVINKNIPFGCCGGCI